MGEQGDEGTDGVTEEGADGDLVAVDHHARLQDTAEAGAGEGEPKDLLDGQVEQRHGLPRRHWQVLEGLARICCAQCRTASVRQADHTTRSGEGLVT